MQVKNGQANIYNGLNVSGSTSLKSSGSTVLSIDGTSGRLFSVDDSLSGSLFSVNTAAGLPVMEAFSDNSVRIGQYGTQALFVSKSRVGIGKESGLNANLDILGTAIVSGSAVGSPAFYVTNGGVQFGSTTGFVWDAVNNRLGIGVTSQTATLEVKGAGATSSTQAVSVFNSSGTNLFYIQNSGNIMVYGAINCGGSLQSSGQFQSLSLIGGANNTGTAISLTAQGASNLTSNLNLVSITRTYDPTTGSAVYNNLVINPTVNQTGGANGITRGLYVQPTLTAAADWRSIQWDNNSGWGLYGAGSGSNYLRGNLSIGTTATGSALTVSGSTTMIGSGSSLLTIDGVSGRLFQVDDSLSGSLFSVNNSTGLPLIEAFSDDTIRMGQFGTRTLFVSQSRVGIGIETPLAKLDVSGSSRFVGNISVTGSLTATVPTVNTYLVQGILNADFSVSASSDVVIPFVDQYDPNNWYDAGTYRCTPTIAGYYMLSIGAWFTDFLATGSQCNIQSRKNNSTIIIVQSPTNNATGQSLTGTKLVYMNGTTDYLDFTAYQSTATAKNLIKGTSDGSGTWFSLHLLTM